MRKIFYVLLSLSFWSAYAGDLNDPHLQDLAKRMVGSFSSATQAEEDEAFYDIRLEMVRIWSDRDDAIWLYIEQAVATHLDKPYRQRVYRVSKLEDGSFESAVFSLPEPEKYMGAHKQEKPLHDLTPENLSVREGCAVILKRDKAGDYIGGTVEKQCTSALRGATYATSEIEIYTDRLVSWDRGWDANDKHVWGAEKAGYIFTKVK